MPPPTLPTQMCPLLTIGEYIRSGLAASAAPRIATVGKQVAQPTTPDAIACQGAACALFMPVADETGKITGGNCSLKLISQGLAMINGSVRDAAGQSTTIPGKN